MTDLQHGFNTSLQDVDDKFAWINDMIKSRQELLVLYMKVLSTSVLEGDKSTYNRKLNYNDITDFCDKLVDYLSTGHFDLYPRILHLMEEISGRSLSIARRVLPKIENTTEYLMRFNDVYSQDLNENKLMSIHRDLVEVGKCLEIRFKNEDRLIIGLKLIK